MYFTYLAWVTAFAVMTACDVAWQLAHSTSNQFSRNPRSKSTAGSGREYK